MRKIAGPGHSSYSFLDYDAATNPNGTVMTADWGNDVQDELRGIEDEFSIAEAAGSNKYILAAIKGLAIKHSKRVGELFWMDDYEAPAEFDKDDPESFFPAKCLNTIDSYEDISTTNWSDLVDHLRARTLTYLKGKTGEKTSLDVTDWAIVSNVATLTFANTAAENAILGALAEDNLVHGSYSNWRTVTLASAIGDITAGTYDITDVDTTARTIDFAFTASDNSGSGSYTVAFYPHRTTSATAARLFQVSDRALITEADDGTVISGLRHRDAMQRITGEASMTSTRGFISDGTGLSGVFSLGDTKADSSTLTTTDGAAMLFDSADSTSPNAAKTDDEKTKPKALGAFLYIHGGSYAA